jgi:thiol-disulfide isomerase/thioredoxin
LKGCGHCKNMKPVFNNVAKRMSEEKIDGVIAAVDATKEQAIGAKFKIDGYPKVKYFK